MALSFTARALSRTSRPVAVQWMSTGDAGSGIGHGGGSGGTIRDAGGSFGKREAALEEQYFRKLQHRQLEKMRVGIEEEVKFHHQQVEEHQAAIKRHHQILDELEMNIRNIEAREKMT